MLFYKSYHEPLPYAYVIGLIISLSASTSAFSRLSACLPHPLDLDLEQISTSLASDFLLDACEYAGSHALAVWAYLEIRHLRLPRF